MTDGKIKAWGREEFSRPPVQRGVRRKRWEGHRWLHRNSYACMNYGGMERGGRDPRGLPPKAATSSLILAWAWGLAEV